MRYFKPELLDGRLLADDAAEAAADAAWERAARACRRRLKRIWLRLPAEVRDLVGSVNLHDAEVLALSAATTGSRFGLLLRLEGRPGGVGDTLAIEYRVVTGAGATTLNHRADGSPPPEERVYVLYDEFGVSKAGHFIHRLLFSNHTEHVIRFHGLNVVRIANAEPPAAATGALAPG
ncbi:MAG: hypothetical protein ACRC33_30735 [Gemmataceae bacterium]